MHGGRGSAPADSRHQIGRPAGSLPASRLPAMPKHIRENRPGPFEGPPTPRLLSAVWLLMSSR